MDFITYVLGASLLALVLANLAMTFRLLNANSELALMLLADKNKAAATLVASTKAQPRHQTEQAQTQETEIRADGLEGWSAEYAKDIGVPYGENGVAR